MWQIVPTLARLACSCALLPCKLTLVVHETTQAAQQNEDLPDLSPVELQLCHDEYRDDEDLRMGRGHDCRLVKFLRQVRVGPYRIAPTMDDSG